MTETRPDPLATPPGHPDLDTLADFDAGVLNPARSAELRQHVSMCARCRGILAGVADVPGLLRRLPPPHLPAEVEARIFAALDAERLARFGPVPPAGPGWPGAMGSGATGPGRAGIAGPGPAAPVVSLAAARERRGRTRLIGLVAAGLVLLTGGALTAVGLYSRSGSSGGGANTAVLAEHSDDSGKGTVPSAPGLPSYDRQTITEAPLLIKILAGGRGRLAPQTDDGGLGGGRLSSCAAGVARQVPGVSGAPAGVQHINFEGRPAFLLVYSGTAGQTLVVVADACTSEDPAVLYSRSL